MWADDEEPTPSRGRSSLGKLIERSISAPPESSSYNRFNDNLVDQMVQQYDGLAIDENKGGVNDFSHLFEEHSAYETNSNSLGNGASTPSTPWREHMSRSQSAAPGLASNMNRPPPGMDGFRSQSVGPATQRPGNSNGSFQSSSSSGALRPSAKTFMDLIQEDYPEEHSSQYPSRLSPNSQGSGFSGMGAPTLAPQKQQQQNFAYQQQQAPTNYEANMGQQPVYINAMPNTMPQNQMFAQQQQQYGSFNPQSMYLQGRVDPQQPQQFVQVVPMQGSAPTNYWQHPGEPSMVNGRHDSFGDRSKGRGGGGGRGQRRNAKESKHSTSSILLEEFRASKNRSWSIFQIENHVVEFCQDQNGSRFIQQRLEMADPREQEAVVREVLPAIRRLRNDVFGNYVVQKLLDFGTEPIKLQIRDTIAGEMLQMSLQMYGCRVVQKALEALSDDDLASLLSEFHHNVLSLIHDQNGNHVIQKCVEVVKTRSMKAQASGDLKRIEYLEGLIEFIISDVLVNTASLSCHPYGCRVLQRILEHANSSRKIDVLDEIKKCHKKLLDDQYGNYVIQHVLQYGRPEDRDSILGIVVENGLLGLSRQKFASNVVEKLLKHGQDRHRRALVREMLKVCLTTGEFERHYTRAHTPVQFADEASSYGSNNGTSVVLLMVRDAYANYVVQTTLDVLSDCEEKYLLVQELNAHTDELRNYTFAKHIVTKLASLTNAY